MKDILFAGHRIPTTDEIADAVLDYARGLAGAGRADVVAFPTIHDGMPSRCALLLGGGGAIAIVDAAGLLPASLSGADAALADLARRADALRSAQG